MKGGHQGDGKQHRIARSAQAMHKLSQEVQVVVAVGQHGAAPREPPQAVEQDVTDAAAGQ